ncbi:MAG: late competence development ComFB family protein [Burkholderiales bacterium]
MSAAFDEIHNLQEQAVFSAIAEMATSFPHFDFELMADVGCVALNRVPPRYVRHTVDFTFYQTASERENDQRAIDEAVRYAFEFVQARSAMRARS